MREKRMRKNGTIILIVLFVTLFNYFKSIVSRMLTWQNLDP